MTYKIPHDEQAVFLNDLYEYGPEVACEVRDIRRTQHSIYLVQNWTMQEAAADRVRKEWIQKQRGKEPT